MQSRFNELARFPFCAFSIEIPIDKNEVRHVSIGALCTIIDRNKNRINSKVMALLNESVFSRRSEKGYFSILHLLLKLKSRIKNRK